MDIQQIQAQRYKFFAVGAIGTFMATLDGSILNVALPSIADDFTAPINLVAWVVLAYALTLISLMVAFGAWTQRRGYNFSYTFGYIFFLIGSSICAMSHSIHMLIVARVIQAIGTAMFAAVGPGLVTTVFPVEERGKGIGIMVMMVSAGFMVGPPLGGWILGQWTWHMIFLINLPVGIVGLFMTRKYFRLLSPPKEKKPIFLPTVMAISLSLVTGVFALSQLDEHSPTDPIVWGLALVSVVLFVVFIKLESQPNRAVIGLEMFRNRTFSASMLAQFAHFSGMSGVLVLIPFYLERVKLMEPQKVGLFLVILPIMMFVAAPASGRMSDRIGFRLLTSLGMIIMGIGLWFLSGLTVETESWYVVMSLVVVGGGVGLFSTPNSSALMGSVTPEQRAVASSMLATNRNIGMSVGVALSTALFAFFRNRNVGLGDENLIFVESYRPVIYVGMCFAAVGLLFCLIRSNRAQAGVPDKQVARPM